MMEEIKPLYTEKEMCKSLMDELRGLSDEDWALLDVQRLVVETDEEEPKIICEITRDGFKILEGYRVRIKP